MCGIVGLFFFNVILGIVDLVIFAVLMIVAANDGGFHWYVGG